MRFSILLFFMTISFLVGFGQVDSIPVYYERGVKEKEARRYREAEKWFLKVYQIDSTNIQNLHYLADVLAEQRRYTEAYSRYEVVYAKEPQRDSALYRLMQYSFNLRKWDACISYATVWEKRFPGQGANLMIAKAYYEKEYYAEVVKYCERAYKENKNLPEIPYLAGRAYMDMNQYKPAAGCYEQALALDSSNANWMYEAALVWYAVPDDKRSLYWMEKAGEKGYKRSNEYLENLASAYINAGQLEKGVKMLEEVLQRKPQDPELIYSIADTYYKIKKWDEAIRYWDMNLTIDKTNARALYMIGMSYQKKGEKEKGMQLCDKAIEMDPSLRKLREERKQEF